MKKHLAKPERITKALARLERIQIQNREQAEQLHTIADRMGLHATKVADENRAAALAGDWDAGQRYLRALRGRAHAQRITS